MPARNRGKNNVEEEIEKLIEKYTYKVEKDKKGRPRKRIFTDDDKPFLRKFLLETWATTGGDGTRGNYLRFLRYYRERVGKPLKDITREDNVLFIASYMEENDDSSTVTVGRMLKRFWRVIHDCGRDETPEVVRNLRLPRVKQKDIEIPTLEWLKTLLKHTDDQKYKALFSADYETGGRIGETLKAKMKQLEIGRGYAIIRYVKETTKGIFERKVVVHRFFADFMAYLNLRGELDPEDYIWVHDRDPSKPLNYQMARRRLIYYCKKAGIKYYGFHKLRHLRSDVLDDKLSFKQKQAYFGWTTAEMVARYGGWKGRRVARDVLAIERKEKVETIPEDEKVLPPKKCPNCKTEHDATKNFCSICGTPLSEEIPIVEAQPIARDLAEANAKLTELTREIEGLKIRLKKDRVLEDLTSEVVARVLKALREKTRDTITDAVLPLAGVEEA